MINSIKYKIGHFFPHYNKRYLSKMSQNEENLFYDCQKRDSVFSKYFSIFLGLELLFLLLIFKYFNLISINIDYLGFFKTILIIPLTFIGFIVPITLLVVNSLSNKHPIYANIYLKCCLKPFSKVLIIILAFMINLGFYFYVYINTSPKGDISNFAAGISLYLILIGLSLILISSFESLKLIKMTIQSFDDEKLYKSIKKHIFNEIIQDINNEMARKTCQRSFKDLCKENNLQTNYLGEGRYGNKFKSISVDGAGFIKDVNTQKLTEFSSLLKNGVSPGILGIVHQVGYPTDGKVLGYVNHKETNYSDLKKLLNTVFIITNEKNEDIKQILDDLKSFTIKSIEKNEETQFKRLIDVYMELLEDYMLCMEKYKRASDSGEEFRFLSLINYDLQDIIQCCSSSSHENLIVTFLLKFSNMSKEAIDHMDYSVMQIIYSIFLTSYLKCTKNKNNLGKDRVFLILENTIDYIINSWDYEKTDLKKFIFLKNLFYDFIGVLLNIARLAIDNKDLKSLDKVLADFEDFHLTPEVEIFNELSELRIHFKTLKKDSREYTNIKDRISLLEKRTKIKTEYQTHLFRLWFEVGSYLICRIKENKIEGPNFKQFIEVLDKFGSYDDLLGAFEATKNEKRVYGSITVVCSENYESMEQCHTFFFCVKGIQLIDSIPAPIASDIIKYKKVNIIAMCNSLKKDITNWEWLIGDDVTKIEDFIEICENS